MEGCLWGQCSATTSAPLSISSNFDHRIPYIVVPCACSPADEASRQGVFRGHHLNHIRVRQEEASQEASHDRGIQGKEGARREAGLILSRQKCSVA